MRGAPKRSREKNTSSKPAVGQRENIRVPIPDDVLARVAAIADVPKDKVKSLRGQLLSAQTEAFRRHGLGHRKHLTIKDLRPHFAKLRKALEALQAEREGEAAGVYIGAVIAPQTLGDWLDAVARAERHAERGLPGRGILKGPRGDTGFRQLTHQIVISVRILGGRLTCKRMSGTDHDKVKGSFADVLELLRKYLPTAFIPGSARAIANTFELADKSTI